jgi:hypothetical protein
MPIYRVSANGEIAKLELRAKNLGGHMSYGTRGPVVSPNQEWIAFTRDNDLWLYDVRSAHEVPVTEVGQPFEPPMKAVFVNIKTWSPDSRFLVYRVSYHEMPPMDYSGPPLQVRQAAYGFYLYDLKSGATTRLNEASDLSHYLLVSHVAWLNDETFLAKTSTQIKPQKVGFSSTLINPTRIFRVSRDGSTMELVGTIEGILIQEQVDDGHKWLVAHVSVERSPEQASYTQILRLDLHTGQAEAITPEGWWNHRHQWPKFAPGGDEIAYECLRMDCLNEKCTERNDYRDVVVGSDHISSCEELRHRFDWIDRETLVVQCGSTIRVINKESGDILGQTVLRQDGDGS